MLEHFHPAFARWCSTKFAAPTAQIAFVLPLEALSNDSQRRAQIG